MREGFYTRCVTDLNTWHVNEMIWFAMKMFLKKERKNPKRFLLKVNLICCDSRELDLKMLSSIATIDCDTLVRMTFNNFWGWDLKIKLSADTLCVSILKVRLLLYPHEHAENFEEAEWGLIFSDGHLVLSLSHNFKNRPWLSPPC